MNDVDPLPPNRKSPAPGGFGVPAGADGYGCKPSGFERDVVIDDRCRRRQHGRKRKQSRQGHPSKAEMMCL